MIGSGLGVAAAADGVWGAGEFDGRNVNPYGRGSRRSSGAIAVGGAPHPGAGPSCLVCPSGCEDAELTDEVEVCEVKAGRLRTSIWGCRRTRSLSLPLSLSCLSRSSFTRADGEGDGPWESVDGWENAGAEGGVGAGAELNRRECAPLYADDEGVTTGELTGGSPYGAGADWK